MTRAELEPALPAEILEALERPLNPSAIDSIDLDAIFAGAGEVADEDDDPDHAKAGWYADPSGAPATLRYWNGKDWTDHVHQIPGGNDLQDPDARPARGRSGRGGRARRARGGGGRSYQ